MKRFIYTPEHLAFLRKKYKTMPVRDLTPAFNDHFGLEKTRSELRAALSNHGIKCRRKTRFQPITAFTPEQIAYIREQYMHHCIHDLLVMLNDHFGINKKITQLKAFLANHKITCGRTGRFEKGLIPWNKGKKGYMGANATSFKPGNEPHNTRHLWCERISKDGIVEISVPETNKHTGYGRRFRSKHAWLWEQHNGPIPEGRVVIFKDGDRSNITIENLLLVTRAELLVANIHGYKDAPEEVKPSILALSRVELAGGFRTVGTRGRQPRNDQHH